MKGNATSFAWWLLDLLMSMLRIEKHEIHRKGFPEYLTRWVLTGKRHGPGRKVFLHLFHRGDAESCSHDHPWPFTSLILWGGYWEITAGGKKWYGPGRILRRPATWQHRVEVPRDRKCLTLVWCGEKVRPWGFICPDGGWVHWKDYMDSLDAGGSGCE